MNQFTESLEQLFIQLEKADRDNIGWLIGFEGSKSARRYSITVYTKDSHNLLSSDAHADTLEECLLQGIAWLNKKK